MSKRDRIQVDKKEEMRTKGSSKMISEGGLGADNYYNIVKESTKKDKSDDVDTTSNEAKEEKEEK